jgi:hypothetical protein
MSFWKKSSMMLSNFVWLLMPRTLSVATEIVFEVFSKEGEDCEEANLAVFCDKMSVLVLVLVLVLF